MLILKEMGDTSLQISHEVCDLIGKVIGKNIGMEKIRETIQEGLVLLLACGW